jgi:Gram-negative porin
MKIKSILVCLGVLLLVLSARAQLQVKGFLSFDYVNGEAQSDYPHSSFENLRGGLFFFGTVSKTFDYNLEVQYRSVTTIEIEEAWVGIPSSDVFQMKLGLYLVPFGIYNKASRPYQTHFVQTPLPAANLYPRSWRDLGIMTQGKYNFFNYAVYLGNGLREGTDLQDGQQFKDNNSNKGVGGRVGFLLSRSFEVGFSYYWGKYDNASTRTSSLWDADLSWKSEFFSLIYEYIKADLDNPAGYSPAEAEGYYAFLAITIKDFSPWASYQTYKYTDPFHGPGFEADVSPGTGISKNQSRWAIGLMYSVTSNIMLKAEYDFNSSPASDLKDDVFSAQVAWNF